MAFSFTDFLTDVGQGIGAFLTATTEPVIAFVLFLGVGFAVVQFVILVKSAVDGSFSKTVKDIQSGKRK